MSNRFHTDEDRYKNSIEAVRWTHVERYDFAPSETVQKASARVQ
jgi:hypothetical protein